MNYSLKDKDPLEKYGPMFWLLVIGMVLLTIICIFGMFLGTWE